jgi:hypothetical protein
MIDKNLIDWEKKKKNKSLFDFEDFRSIAKQKKKKKKVIEN